MNTKRGRGFIPYAKQHRHQPLSMLIVWRISSVFGGFFRAIVWNQAGGILKPPDRKASGYQFTAASLGEVVKIDIFPSAKKAVRRAPNQSIHGSGCDLGRSGKISEG